MKKTMAILMSLILIIGMQANVTAAQADHSGYMVTFVSDHAAVDVYYTQDYTAANESNVTAAYARNSDTGEIDTTGNGQVNFLIRVEEGYKLQSVTADAHYKNIKGEEDTGVENLCRITKITGDVLVTITTVKTEDVSGGDEEENGYPVNFHADHARIDIYYTQDYTAADETNVTAAYARSSSTGEIDTSGDGQVNFKVTAEEGYIVTDVSADTNYKNLKGSADTGVENLYRLTKITGEVNVTVNTMDSAAAESTVRINEVNSSPDDWVEIINIGSENAELSGYELRDNSDDHRWRFADGTVIGAGEILLVDAHTAGLVYNDTTGEYAAGEFQDAYGLGAGDSIRLYSDAGILIDSCSWTEHASYGGDAAKASCGRYPDGSGSFVIMPETPGKPNEQALKEDVPDNNGSITERLNAIDWPGPDTVTVSDLVFQEDSSGLDFADGRLYAIDNGTATLWVLDVSWDGTLSFSGGYENGRRIRYQKDADNASAAGPDTEGITVDEAGYVYVASERDNGDKGVNYDSILMVDPREEGDFLTARQEWDLTHILPEVSANMGIEAVEWVSNADVQGVLWDQNTQAVFDAAAYPDAVSGGVFFAALESNGHVYAFVLNNDSSAVMIADIDSGIGGAMALDYDTYEKVLWVAADNGFENISAKVSLNKTAAPHIVYVSPAGGLDRTANNEGFAIADAEYTADGLRAVYHFTDGVKKGALSITYLYCDYTDAPDTGQDQEPVQYRIMEGANGIWTEGSQDGLEFTVNADFSKFVRVETDGAEADRSCCEINEAAAAIKLTGDYLATLSIGSHTLTLVFSDGTASTQFEIQASVQTDPGNEEDGNKDNGNKDDQEAPDMSDKKDNNKDDQEAPVKDNQNEIDKDSKADTALTAAAASPQTEDSSLPVFWGILLVLSLSGTAFLMIRIRKRSKYPRS